jgi:hypothetical protein
MGSEKKPIGARAIILLRRKEGMTREEFNDHWLNVHGEIAKGYPHVIRYSQLHINEARADTGESVDFGVDGIVDFILDDAANWPKIWETEIGKVGVEDGAKFIGQIMEVFVTEHHIVGEELNPFAE